MSRRRQALWALLWFVGGCAGAVAGGLGYDNGIAWLDRGAIVVTGGCWGLAGVFLLRAVLPGRVRAWWMPNTDPEKDIYGYPRRPD